MDHDFIGAGLVAQLEQLMEWVSDPEEERRSSFLEVMSERLERVVEPPLRSPPRIARTEPLWL